MGVQIYILEPRKSILWIDNSKQEIGTLRRSWKLTEIDAERQMEIDNSKENFRHKLAPVAAMLADVTELKLVGDKHRSVAAHLVLGWDPDRSSVTDFAWDYLPILGYAVRTQPSTSYTLHEETKDGLSPISHFRAVELGIHNEGGQFVRRGQPEIVICRGVRHYIKGFVEADCTLSDGRAVEILTASESLHLPTSAWYLGKRPVDVSRYEYFD